MVQDRINNQNSEAILRLNCFNYLSIASATAALGYVGCGAATIGYGFCAAAVFVMHVAMTDNCVLDYDECKG